MLTGVYDGFRSGDAQVSHDLSGTSGAPDGAMLIRWLRPATLWPGDILEDVDNSCFYDAGGLDEGQLARLQEPPAVTVAEAGQRFGRDFIERHLPRLLALGFVALIPADEPTANNPGRNA